MADGDFSWWRSVERTDMGGSARGTARVRPRISMTMAVVVHAVAALVQSSTAEAQQYQWGAVHRYWHFPGPAWNVDTYMWPAQVSNADFLTQQFWFEDGGAAYMGLQEQGDGHRQVRFSVWNATAARESAATGSWCRDFGGEGVGKTCTLPYAFRTGDWYRLRIWLTERDSEGDWWGAWVIDDAGEEQHIGSIRAPARSGLIQGAVSFNEYFGTSVGFPCGQLPPSAVYVYQPLLDNGASRASMGAPNMHRCAAGRVRSLWNDTLSSLELRYERVTAPAPVRPPAGLPQLAQDRAVLEALYDATDGPSWTNDANWKTSAPLGEWYGVTTDGAGSVTELSLDDNGLTGSIPPALEDLANLEVLSLEENELTGPVPAWLGNMTGLRWLTLGGNGLTGPIPGALARLVNLERLYLWGNGLTGPIPALGTLRSLTRLHLRANRLTGEIPSELADLAALQVLSLRDNELTGPVPSWLGTLANLRILSLGNNRLTGPIPAELTNLTGLRYLLLHDNELTGPIPSWLGTLTNLERLYLGGNALTGRIPPELANLRNLERLILLELRLNGRIPAWLGDLTNLSELNLGDSGLTGPIPPELRNLAGLRGLYLWKLELTGPIPPWLGTLTSLEALSLSRNGLTGTIPPEWGDLTNLRQLWLYENPLEGRVPETFRGLALRTFWIHETDACVPEDPAFRSWVERIEDFRGDICVSSANRSPEPVGTISAQTLGESDGAIALNVEPYFRDPDGDPLTYAAVSSDRGVVTAAVTGGTVFLTPVSAGAATVTVTARDPAGLSAAQAVAVTVSPPANRPPEAVGVLAPLTIAVAEPPVTVEVSGAFRDPDGDRLTYGAGSSAPGVASVSVSGSRVMVRAVSAGTATVTVSATDTGGSNTAATQAFTVTVPRAFTDQPLVAGVTPVRAVHFTELRARIDGVRRSVGLGPYAWTDPVLTSGVTRVRLVHLTEMRWALAPVFGAKGRRPPFWTDAASTPGSTPIRAAHLMELRAAVAALE